MRLIDCMNLPFELHIALRYLLAKRKQAFISVISLISTLGVTVGVMALVIALALMTGLQGELRDRILGSNPHIFVWKPRRHRRLPARARARCGSEPHVIGAAPAIIGKALVSGGGRPGLHQHQRDRPRSMEPQVTDIAGAMRSGNVESSSNHDSESTSPGILLGSRPGATDSG